MPIAIVQPIANVSTIIKDKININFIINKIMRASITPALELNIKMERLLH